MVCELSNVQRLRSWNHHNTFRSLERSQHHVHSVVDADEEARHGWISHCQMTKLHSLTAPQRPDRACRSDHVTVATRYEGRIAVRHVHALEYQTLDQAFGHTVRVQRRGGLVCADADDPTHAGLFGGSHDAPRAVDIHTDGSRW